MLQRTLPAGFVVAPCLPTKAETLPSGGAWLHEIKHDGFRIIARKDGPRVRLFSRPGNDLTGRFPLIVETLAGLRARSCIIDGERTLPPAPVLPSRAAFPSTGSVHFVEDRLENRSSRRGLRNRWTFWHRGQCVDRHDRCDRKDHRKDELEHKVRCHLFPPRCSDPPDVASTAISARPL